MHRPLFLSQTLHWCTLGNTLAVRLSREAVQAFRRHTAIFLLLPATTQAPFVFPELMPPSWDLTPTQSCRRLGQGLPQSYLSNKQSACINKPNSDSWDH